MRLQNPESHVPWNKQKKQDQEKTHETLKENLKKLHKNREPLGIGKSVS